MHDSPFMVPWVKRADLENQQEDDKEEEQPDQPKERSSGEQGSNERPVWMPQCVRREQPGWLSEIRLAKRKAHCLKEYDDALSLLKAGTFRTRKQLAEHYGKRADWAGQMVSLMLRFNDLSPEEVLRYLPGRRTKTD